ncbi:toll/interleukin-1 receptor domain-containing protein [Telmatobacter sp. DSM 110680]|uniref:Toll/interleukin-1 receptor domain-containing protein n=1 Tax=Telmatobacter sp. DSM 110680 TaxID=3036704 RepID=A0AAU7DN26_9BACT
MSKAKYDVFLSYSRADTERVAPLLDELRRMGYCVFFDVQSIDPGEQWKRRLERSVRASRALVLCWSEHARGSDYITFEYSRAEALQKPVFPWLLDRTPLPAMLEVQGITTVDVAQVAAQLKRSLGWTVGRRRKLWAALAVMAAGLTGIALWFVVRPPPPWQFSAQVTDRVTGVPVSGVEVDVVVGQSKMNRAFTGPDGLCTIRLPQPKSSTVHIFLRKQGYERDEAVVPSNKIFITDMEKLP